MNKPNFFHRNVVFTLFLGISTWFVSCFNGNKVAAKPTNINQEMNMKSSEDFYKLKAKTVDGREISMSDFKGKKIIILNVASKCGFTPQYADWELFYKYNKENAIVLGFPCNQFLDQEPGTNAEIASFCSINYGVTFPIFEKTDVKGEHANDVYAWLTHKERNGWNDEVPSWNFCKYIISEDGSLTHFLASKITPTSPEFLEAMKEK